MGASGVPCPSPALPQCPLGHGHTTAHMLQPIPNCDAKGGQVAPSTWMRDRQGTGDAVLFWPLLASALGRTYAHRSSSETQRPLHMRCPPMGQCLLSIINSRVCPARHRRGGSICCHRSCLFCCPSSTISSSGRYPL